MTISLDDQLACVRRELTRRTTDYPGLVARRSMTQAWADFQLAAMTAVLETLTRVQQAEDPAEAPHG